MRLKTNWSRPKMNSVPGNLRLIGKPNQNNPPAKTLPDNSPLQECKMVGEAVTDCKRDQADIHARSSTPILNLLCVIHRLSGELVSALRGMNEGSWAAQKRWSLSTCETLSHLRNIAKKTRFNVPSLYGLVH